MDFSILKTQAPLMAATFLADPVITEVTTEQAGIVQVFVQVIIGILSIVGFFRNRKNR